MANYHSQKAGTSGGKFPTLKPSRLACQFLRSWLESQEFNNAPTMGFGRSILVLLPFFDCRVSNSKSQRFGQLRHGQRQVNPLLAEVFSKRRRSRRVAT